VYYAVYDGALPSGPEGEVVYLVNTTSTARRNHPSLVVQGKHEFSISVPGARMRIAWVIEDILFSPDDRYVKLTDARRDGDAWLLTVESIPARQEGLPGEARFDSTWSGGAGMSAVTLTQVSRDRKRRRKEKLSCGGVARAG